MQLASGSDTSQLIMCIMLRQIRPRGAHIGLNQAAHFVTHVPLIDDLILPAGATP